MKNTAYLLFILLMAGQSTFCQPTDVPYHYEQKELKLGPLAGKELNAHMIEYSQYFYYQKTKAQTTPFPEADYLKINQTITAKEKAPWMRLRFSDVDLGKNSYLIITSEYDGDQQFFNAQSIKDWQNQTAFLNGNTLQLQLMVAPGDSSIFAQLSEISVGEFLGNTPPVDYLCYGDSRVQSSYENVDGRILPIGCSGWITAGGFYITAGHCLDVGTYDLQVIQFHVPNSLCDGTLVACAAADQYPIIFSSRVYQNSDTGDDWGIFNVGTNSNTGKTPLEAERSYYHLSKSLAPSYILVRGFGTDQNPSGCEGSYNSYSQTLQYDIGASLGEFFNGSYDVYFEYLADTQGGSSGSVLQSNGISGVTRHAIGVHTYGSCNPPSYGNRGTSFEADDTEAAMNSYWQSNCEYVDEGHHFSSTVGSAVLPHQWLQTALNQADAGHGPGTSALELILVAGSNNGSGGNYSESVSYSGASNGVVIRPSAGAIKIGPAAKTDSTSRIKENTSLTDLSQSKTNKITKQNFDENTILPGQTIPFQDMIRLHENDEY